MYIKKRINRSLENMAKENKRQFGNGRLDCCDLQKKSEKQL
ncbi:LDCC motif putative metal-binding protein [Spirochaeta lutea]